MYLLEQFFSTKGLCLKSGVAGIFEQQFQTKFFLPFFNHPSFCQAGPEV
jgi:hypothetical protein